MFIMKFESDSRGPCPDIQYVTRTSEYRVRRSAGCVDVLIPNSNGVEIAHTISEALDTYDRCYVMNAEGKTIDKILYGQPKATA